MRLGAGVLAAWVFWIAAAWPPVPARGDDELAPQPVIIVVDYLQVVRDAAATQSIQAAIDTVRAAYQEEFGALEQELREIEQRLTEERATLEPEELMARRTEFEERVTEAQREARNRRLLLERAQGHAMEQVQNALLDVIAEIANERGANLVLGKSQIVLVDSTLDVTAEALRRLDERLPSVDVTIPTE